MKNKSRTNPLIHIFFILWGLICIVPFWINVAASFTSEIELTVHGFGLWPRNGVDWSAYKYLFANPEQVTNAYAVTIFHTVVATFLSVLIMLMTGYSLSRANFIWKNAVTWLLFFPSLFSGGMVAEYIVNTQWYHLKNSWLIYVIFGLNNFFHIVMFRTFFKQLPEGLFDAAKIDGSSEFGILTRMAIPLSTPVIATVAFMGAMGRWNTWYVCQLYVTKEEMYSLQYLLQRMMMSIQSIMEDMEKVPNLNIDTSGIPGENLRMAMMVVCIGPMMMVFPFFQKYFTKGMTVGAVKG